MQVRNSRLKYQARCPGHWVKDWDFYGIPQAKGGGAVSNSIFLASCVGEAVRKLNLLITSYPWNRCYDDDFVVSINWVPQNTPKWMVYDGNT